MSSTILKSVLSGVLCGLAPALVGAAEPIETATYRKLCSECHPRAERLASRFEGTEPAASEARWQAFLIRHHAPDGTDRETLIRYFQSLRTGG